MMRGRPADLSSTCPGAAAIETARTMDLGIL